MRDLDQYIDCGCVSPGSLNEPGRHFCGKYNPSLPAPEPGATIGDLDNDCGFMGTYAEHRAMGCCTPMTGQWHAFTENINDASMCVCGVPDLGHDDVYPPRPHCADCLRPLPHTDAEARVCGSRVSPA